MANIKTALITAAGKTRFWTMQHSPELLLAAGVATGVACVVMACKATLKSKPIVDSAKEQIEDIEALEEFEEAKAARREEDGIEAEYPDPEVSTKKIVAKTTLQVARAYAPAVTLGVVSVGCILASYKILDKRLVGATAAYEGLNAAFKKYRARVVEKYGQEADEELYYGKNNLQPVKKQATNEDGTVTEVEELEPNVEKDVPWCSMYAFAINEDTDRSFVDPFELRYIQNSLAERLDREGFVLLNDVRKMFGKPIIGKYVGVGWISARMIEKLGLIGKYSGDGYITFNVLEGKNDQARSYMEGHSKKVILDCNVDGPIYNLIDLIQTNKWQDPEYICDTDAYKSVGGIPGVV